MLLKIYKYQINGFAKNCLERSIDRILEETNKFYLIKFYFLLKKINYTKSPHFRLLA